MKIYIMRKELGKWFMDIAKYMTTAVLLTALFRDMEYWDWYMFLAVFLAVLLTIATGLSLINEKKGE